MTSVEKDFTRDQFAELVEYYQKDFPEQISDADADALDLPPEFCTYTDEGCRLSPSCLNCPFPTCAEDIPSGRRKWYKEFRDREIVRLHKRIKNLKHLAARFHLSEKTVRRIIERSTLLRK